MTSKSTLKRVTVQKTGKMPEPTHRTQDFEQLIMIANLEDNWDRYGAERVCDECVENVKSVISSLPPFVPSPDIFPNPNGTVTLEWDEDVGSFSIEIGKEEFSSFLEVAGNQRYYQGHFELGLPDFAREIIQSLSRIRSCIAMRTGHLFAGAGGGLLADKILGHTPVFAVEWDAKCCRNLRENAAAGWYPGLRVHEGDARLFDPSEYAGRVDSIHAGFPCTDISVAGNGEGIDGDQSGLWSEVARVAGILRPSELYLENSPAIVDRGLDRVLSDLAALGYDAKWLCLSAASVGAPHERDRWWCLATMGNLGGRRLLQPEKGEDQQPGKTGVKRPSDATNLDRKRELQPQGGDGEFRRWAGDGAQEAADAESQRPPAGRTSGGFSEGLPEFADPGWWSTEPDVGRMVHGVADGPHRIKALGNGQAPIQAAVAYRLLKGE